MVIIDRARKINPASSGTVLLVFDEPADQPVAPGSDFTRPDADYCADRAPAPAVRRPVERRWLCVAERLTRGLPLSLRGSIALAAVLIVLAVIIVVTLDLPGALVVLVMGLTFRRLGAGHHR